MTRRSGEPGGMILAPGSGEKRPSRLSLSALQARAARQDVRLRIARGSDPAEDALEAARRGVFGLILISHRRTRTPGVICFTPYGEPPESLATDHQGCTRDEEQLAWENYAERYNRALVEAPNYPHADLCRPALPGEPMPTDASGAATPARSVDRPATTLHEAARRGTAAEVDRLLIQEVNALDALGMTPLAWAVARDNAEAVDRLLAAGADPWLSGRGREDAVFWAARLPRRDTFARLESMPGRPFARWPAEHLAAAARGGDGAIIARMLAQPHEPCLMRLLGGSLPATDALEPILAREPEGANLLLATALGYPQDRPDLVALALRHGADPDSPGGGHFVGTTLCAVSDGIAAASVEMVGMLLEAGADPNLSSHGKRPVWIALSSMRTGASAAVRERSERILARLLDAGADVNRTDHAGVPAAWLLLCPDGNHEKLDTASLSLSVLERLVRSGLDVESGWRGKRLLEAVDAQAGANSALARTLRGLGGAAQASERAG